MAERYTYIYAPAVTTAQTTADDLLRIILDNILYIDSANPAAAAATEAVQVAAAVAIAVAAAAAAAAVRATAVAAELSAAAVIAAEAAAFVPHPS